MASEDTLYGKRISETYPLLLQITSGGTVLDGSGSTRSLFVGSNFSATTFYSGSTELGALLSSIFSATNDITRVQPGINTFTGGTGNLSTINITGVSIDNIAVSGSSIFGSGVTFNLPGDQSIIVNGSTSSRSATTGIFQIIQKPSISGTRAINIITNTDGLGDTNSISVDYVASGITGTDVGSGIKVQIDKSNSVGGRITAFRASTLVNSGTTDVVGLFTTSQVSPILQQVGENANIDKAFIYSANTSGYTDVTSAFSSQTINVSIFESVNDYIYVGSINKFNQISFVFQSYADKSGVKPLFEYSKGSDVWTSFVPIDGTKGMRNNGVVTWALNIIGDWAQNTVSGSNNYWVRIKRQNAISINTPIERFVQVVSSGVAEYRWDKNGNVNLNSLTANTISGGTIYSGSTELWSIVKKNISGFTTILKFGSGAISPVDSTSYYIGEWSSELPGTISGDRRINCPNSGIIKNIFINARRSSTIPSPDIPTFYLRLYDTSETFQREDIICTIDLSPANSNFTGNTMNVQLSSNTGYCEIRMLTPIWATGATNVFFGGGIFIS